eukprot:TRINITY_DN309_c0_g2_i2.p1 TRINITY_DN309_c0_g2~~TRINITY_DN309_c0_g2_i2.p1  ORF type:complete len:985 (-),score=87.03 TRINITY_DN309_c0_g2_i2:39-2993(-)
MCIRDSINAEYMGTVYRKSQNDPQEQQLGANFLQKIERGDTPKEKKKKITHTKHTFRLFPGGNLPFQQTLQQTLLQTSSFQMDYFLNFKHVEHKEAYKAYLNQRGALFHEKNLRNLIVYFLVYSLQTILRYFVIEDENLTPSSRLVRMVSTFSVTLIVIGFYFTYKRFYPFRPHLRILSVVSSHVGVLLIFFIQVTDIKDYLLRHEPTGQVLNFSLSALVKVFLEVFLSILYCPYYIMNIMLIIVFFGVLQLYSIQYMYDVYWVDAMRTFVICTALCLILYLKEKHFRELLMRLHNANQDERKWRELMRWLPEGMIALDEKGDVAFANFTTQRILGVPDALFTEEEQNQYVAKCLKDTKLTKINSMRRPHSKTFTDIEGAGDEDNQVSWDGFFSDIRYSMEGERILDPSGQSPTRRLKKFRSVLLQRELEAGSKSKRSYEIRVNCLASEQSFRSVIFFLDVTERLENAKLRDISTYKSRLLASVSHELRTPLNGSIGLLEVAYQDDGLSKKIRDEYVKPSLDCLNYLVCMINDILDYSELSTKTLKIKRSHHNLKQIVDEVVSLNQYAMQQKGLTFSLIMHRDLPEVVFVDRDRLKQVLLNLLNNAVKFTFQGVVTLEVKNEDPKNNVIMFKVADTGVGIEKKVQTKIRALLQAPESEKDLSLSSDPAKLTGASLGLMISGALAKAIGARDGIQFESTLNVGTTFWFALPSDPDTFPMTDAHEQSKDYSASNLDLSYGNEFCTTTKMDTNRLTNYSTELKPSRTARARNNYQKFRFHHKIVSVEMRLEEKEPKHVFIVDDNPFNLQVLTKMLTRKFGFVCHTAYNGKEAVERIVEMSSSSQRNRTKLDMIFMDCDMPVMDGFEATKILRELMNKGELPEIPIVACTAYAFQNNFERCLDVGMQDYISKPVVGRELENLIAKWVPSFNTPEPQSFMAFQSFLSYTLLCHFNSIPLWFSLFFAKNHVFNQKSIFKFFYKPLTLHIL